MKLTINANRFAAAYSVAAKDDVRHYLNGVAIEPHKDGGCFIVATDGHRLAVVYDAAASLSGDDIGKYAMPFIVKVEERLVRACAKANDDAALELDIPLLGVTVTTTQTLSTGRKAVAVASELEQIDGKYPDWRRVIPKVGHSGKQSLLAVNARYVAEFSDLFRKVDFRGKVTDAGIHIHCGKDAEDALLITNPQYSDRLGVLMPMRVGDVKALPDLPGIDLRVAPKRAKAAAAAEQAAA